jgi:hypothetical protein
VGSLVYIVNRFMRGSGAYANALRQANACPALVGAFGKFEPHGIISGNLTEGATEGDADLSIPVVGANRGRGDLAVRATKSGGIWTINHLAFERANQEIEIVTDGVTQCGEGSKKQAK